MLDDPVLSRGTATAHGARHPRQRARRAKCLGPLFLPHRNVDEFEVDAYLNGLITLTRQDRDLVSHAVNELISETRPPTAPYSDDPDLNDAEVLAALNALTSLYHRKHQSDREQREEPGDGE